MNLSDPLFESLLKLNNSLSVSIGNLGARLRKFNSNVNSLIEKKFRISDLKQLSRAII